MGAHTLGDLTAMIAVVALILVLVKPSSGGFAVSFVKDLGDAFYRTVSATYESVGSPVPAPHGSSYSGNATPSQIPNAVSPPAPSGSF